jgi:hypothetical protein
LKSFEIEIFIRHFENAERFSVHCSRNSLRGKKVGSEKMTIRISFCPGIVCSWGNNARRPANRNCKSVRLSEWVLSGFVCTPPLLVSSHLAVVDAKRDQAETKDPSTAKKKSNIKFSNRPFRSKKNKV